MNKDFNSIIKVFFWLVVVASFISVLNGYNESSYWYTTLVFTCINIVGILTMLVYKRLAGLWLVMLVSLFTLSYSFIIKSEPMILAEVPRALNVFVVFPLILCLRKNKKSGWKIMFENGWW